MTDPRRFQEPPAVRFRPLGHGVPRGRLRELIELERTLSGRVATSAVDAARGNALAWHAYLLISALLVVFYLFLAPLKGQPVLFDLLGASGVIAVIGGIRRNRPAGTDAWRWFAVGLALCWLGDFFTRTLRPLLHVAVVFPSAGDAVHLAAYPALMGGLLLIVRRRKRSASGGAYASSVIDTMIITLGLALLSGFVLVAPYLRVTGLALLPKLVSAGYPIADIFLLAACTRLSVDSARKQPAFYLLIASIISLLGVDFVYGVLRLHGAYHQQLFLDGGWLAFYVLWGAAALHPSMRELDQGELGLAPKLTWFRVTLLAAASMIAPAVGLAKEVGSSDPNVLIIIASSIVLFGLVIARMADLVRQREQTASRERTLAQAGTMLVSATTPLEIAGAVLEATAELSGRQCQARFCLFGASALDVFGGQDPKVEVGQWTGDARALAALRRIPAQRTISRHVLEVLRLPGRGEVRVLELPVRGEYAGALVLDCSGNVAESVIASLDHLMTQAALAVETATLTEQMHRSSTESRISSLIQNSSDLITVLDEQLIVTYQSPSIARVLGYEPRDLVGSSFGRLLEEESREVVLTRLREGSGDRRQHEAIECVLRHCDGSLRHFEILRADLLEDGSVHGIVLNGRDVSERKAFEEQLAHQAFHDPVTHLANRALFNERVRHAIARSRREGSGLAVIFIDLDDFKTVNDSLGHSSGDEVLRQVAERLALCVRAGDTVARFGGDEFALLLEDVERPSVAAETADRLLKVLARPVPVEGTELRIRASLGISIAEPGSHTQGDELVRNADAAMYIAKAEGKGGYRLFEPAMHERILSRLELRRDLERALVSDEFELFYQPSVHLDDGRVHGLEALIRWRHPTRGLVGPDSFIPFAEESGMIVQIGKWVLQRGCEQGAMMRKRLMPGMPLSIAVNLSVKQLFDPDIVADVRAALRDSGLDPAALTLEITESSMMVDTELAVRRLAELKALGLRLAIDDFGTGYSSLSYLSRFPVDIVKMDRSLLQAGASAETTGLVGAVVSLGRTFDLSVVAEGIEWEEQWNSLRDLGCDLGQGFFFSQPMHARATLRYLDRHAGDSSTVLPG